LAFSGEPVGIAAKFVYPGTDPRGIAKWHTDPSSNSRTRTLSPTPDRFACWSMVAAAAAAA